MPSYSYSEPVAAPADVVWGFISDPARFAGLFPYMTISDVQAPEPGHWVLWRRLDIPNLAVLNWREDERITGEGEMHFRAVDGDLKTFDGRWRVTPGDRGSVLSLELEYEVPPGVGPKVPAALVRYVMGEIFKSICQRVKDASEEAAR